MRYFSLFFLILITSSRDIWADELLPQNWEQQLDSTKQQNNLEDWIYTWVDVLGENPENTQVWTERILEERWRKPETEDEHTAWLLLLVNQGFNLLQHGNIIQSITAYENAYHYYTDYPFMPPEEVVEHIVFPLGNNYTRLGDYPRALFIQEKGLSLIQDINNPQLLASMYSNLAISSRWAGNPGQASIYASSGLIVPGINSVIKAQLLTSLADIELFREVSDGPDEYAREAYDILIKQPLTADIAQRLSSVQLVIAGVHTAAKRYTQAIPALNQALHLLNTHFAGSKPREKSKIWVEKGTVYLKMKKYRQALDCYNNAIALLLPKNNPAYLYAESALLDATLGMAKAHTGLHMPELALEDYQTAFSVSEKLRQIFYSQSSKKQQQQLMRAMAEEAIALAFSLYESSHDPQYAVIALSMAEQHKARVLADELNRHIALGKLDETNPLVQQERRLSRAVSFYESELMQALINGQADTLSIRKKMDDVNYQLSLLQPRLNAHFPALSARAPLTIRVTQDQLEQLPKGVQVQAYFCGLSDWYAFSFTKTGIHSFERIGVAQELDSVVNHFNNTYFQQGAMALYNHPKAYLADAEILFGRLFRIRQRERPLLVIADGPLSLLPFDALITHSTSSNSVQEWPFLTKEHRLSAAYSLANWYEQANGKALRKTTGNFAGFFVPFTGIYGQDELPAVQAEMTLLKNMVRGQFFWDEAAESTSLLALLPQSDVVHISTHAMLVGPERVPMLLFRDRQVLIPDLYQSMIQPSLVVLGACQSGSGRLDTGEGLLSLAREFVARGTGGVVSGLWNINDEVAARFMEKFYKHLLAGENKAEALHKAKTDWLSDPEVSPLHKLPYYWAGIVYNGDFESVRLKRAWPWSNPAHVATTLLVISSLGAVGWLWWQRRSIRSIFNRKLIRR